jgi:hypothetical protein
MAESQTTLSLLLQAKDEASSVFKQVGDQMATLGRQAEALTEKAQARGFDVGNVEALRTVTKAQTEIVRQGVSERMQAIANEGRDFAAAYRADAIEALRASREKRDKEIEDARATRDFKLAALKDETTLSKAERKTQQDAIRTEANAAMAQARADHTERLRMNRDALAANMAEVQRYVAAERAPLRFAVPAVAAGAEQQRAADILRGTTEARVMAEDRMGALQEALRIPEPEGLKLAAVDLHKIAEDAAQAVPSVKEFAASLRQAIAGAGDRPADQFAAIRTAVGEATQVIKTGARDQTDTVRSAAQEQKQAIAASLTEQKDRINEYVRSQMAQIEMFSRQIQQLLRSAYSAPGISDALKAEGQKVIEDLRLQSDAMAEIYRSRGQEMTREAEHAAQDARNAVDTQLKAEVRAIQNATQEEIEARRQAGAKMTASLREAARAAEEQQMQMHAAWKGLGTAAEEAISPLNRLLARNTTMMLQYNLFYPVINQLTQGLTSLAAGFISTNASLEQTSKTFAAVYQTTTGQAMQIVNALDVFAAKVPGTRQEVREAALAFAAAGDNVREILPAAANLAAIMGVDMPKAAQAMVDAQMGRFEMLQVTLKTTKQELQGYGLEVDHAGHVTSNSFAPAIERYVATRFGEHVAFDTDALKSFQRQLQTTGAQAGVVAQDITAAAMIHAGEMPGDTTQQQAARQTVLLQTLKDIHGAQQGNLADLHALSQMYGVTAADLDKIDKNWRATGASAEAAFAKWYAATHGGEAALRGVQAQQSAIQLQMETLTGAFSNVQDAFTHIQQVIGQGMFNVLHDQVVRLYNTLQSPVFVAFAYDLGHVLGDALQHVIDMFKQWYERMGGLQGVLMLVERAARTVWGAIQGLGDAFHDVGAILGLILEPIKLVLAAFGGSDMAADSMRLLVRVVVDLAIAMRALSVFQAVAGFIGVMTAAAQRATTELARLATAQAAVAATAEAETVAEGSAGTAIAGAAVKGEVGAVAGGVAGSAGLLATAGAGLAELGAAALATLGPFALVVGAFAAVGIAAKLATDAMEREAEHKRAAQFVPSRAYEFVPEQHPSTSQFIATMMTGAAGGGGFVPPPERQVETTASAALQFRRTLPKDALSAYDKALKDHDAAWVDYLSENPKVLAQLNTFLKEHGNQAQITAQKLQAEIAQNRGFTQSDVTTRVSSYNDAIARFKADVKAQDYNAAASQLSMVKQATFDLSYAQGKSIDDATKESVNIVKTLFGQYRSKLPKQVQDDIQALIGGSLGLPGQAGTGPTYSADVFQKNLQEAQARLKGALDQNAPWTTIRDAFGYVQDVARRGQRDVTQDSDAMWATIRAAMQQISQHAQQKLQFDTSIGMPLTVLQQDVRDWIGHLQEIHTPLQDIAQQVVPSILQMAQQEIPDLVKAGPDAAAQYFATVKAELARSGLDARAQAAAFANVYADFQKAQVQQAQQALQTDVALGTVPVADELSAADDAIKGMLKANTAAIKAHKPPPFSDNEIALARKQMTDSIFQPGVQAAQTTLQYDEAIKAPWAQITADIQAYAEALHNTSMPAKEQALLVHQAWTQALGTHQQNLDLQLQYDQMMNAPLATIVKDIQGIGAAMTAAGEDSRTVAIKVHQLMSQATEQYRQQALTAGQNVFALAQEQNRVRTPQDVMNYVNSQMVLQRQAPLQPGETQAQRNVSLALQQNHLIQSGFEGLIAQARKHFEFDTSPQGNAAMALKDENRILALTAQEQKKMGLSPADIAFNSRVLRAQLEQSRQGSYTRPAEPRYMPYGGLGRQPGFGGVEVMFGGPQADPTSRIVAELRYQNEHLREQVKHLQALLYPMQQTASNTGQTARNTSGHTMGHEATYPAPPQPSTAAMRRGGGMVPVPV